VCDIKPWLYCTSLSDSLPEFLAGKFFTEPRVKRVILTTSYIINALVIRRTVLYDLSVLAIRRTVQINSGPTEIVIYFWKQSGDLRG